MDTRKKVSGLIGICMFASVLSMVNRGLIAVPLKFTLKERFHVSPMGMAR